MRLRISYFSVDTFGNEDYNIGKSGKEKYMFWIFRRYSLWAKSLEIGSKDYCVIRG